MSNAIILGGNTVLFGGSSILAGTVTPPSPPDAPANLAFSSIAETTLSLTWDAVGAATSYRVYVDDVLTHSPVTNSQGLTGLSSWQIYAIHVTAVNGDGESGESNTVSPQMADTTAPTAPTIAEVSKTHNSITVSLSGGVDPSPGSGNADWNIYVDGDLAGSTAVSPFVITGLTPETLYAITAKREDVAGNESVASNSLTITTDAAPDLTPPANPTSAATVVVASEGGEISWTASVAGTNPVSYYQIYNGATLIGRTKATNFFIQDLTPSTAYPNIAVRAMDTAGNPSGLTSIASFTTAGGMTTVSTATGINSGGLQIDKIFRDQVTVTTSAAVVFKFCKFEIDAQFFDHEAVFVNANSGNDSHVEFYACEWEGQPQDDGDVQGKALRQYGWGMNNTCIIEHCRGKGYRGFFLQLMGNGTTTFPNIRIRYNRWERINGLKHNGAGGFYYEDVDGTPENDQFVMIQVAALGASGSVEVSCNSIRNEDGGEGTNAANASRVEDTINFYEVVATVGNPAKIYDNIIYGAYGYSAGGNKSYSGAAIQIEGDSRYVIARGNYCMSTGNTGPAISWARYCQINNSKVISAPFALGSDARICQLWEPLLIGNPFWMTALTDDNSGADNYIHFWEHQTADCTPQSYAEKDIYVLSNEFVSNNTATGTLYGTGAPVRADEEAAETEFFALRAAEGNMIGYTL